MNLKKIGIVLAIILFLLIFVRPLFYTSSDVEAKSNNLPVITINDSITKPLTTTQAMIKIDNISDTVSSVYHEVKASSSKYVTTSTRTDYKSKGNEEDTYTTVNDKIENTEEAQYTEDELQLLAHLIYAEANVFYNSDTGRMEKCSDLWQCYVACVALNRVDSSLFPNTLKEVIFQKGQYACTWDGNFEREPDEKAYLNATKVLEGYRPLPKNVVFQAQFKQGNGVYEKIGNTYFCYY